jgi:hypothetical protein
MDVQIDPYLWFNVNEVMGNSVTQLLTDLLYFLLSFDNT